MKRRDAIAALVALPSVSRIARMDFASPSDVIVVECDGLLSKTTRDGIAASVQQVWPDRKIIVVDSGMRLKLVPGA